MVLLSIIYVVVRWLLGVLAVIVRREVAKDVLATRCMVDGFGFPPNDPHAAAGDGAAGPRGRGADAG
jgi:hypothetical protein